MGLPERIAGYEIEDRLGQGGMGTVYLARDPELGRRVALKLIQAELDSADARDRFTKEARSIAALNHPNIVTLYHSGHFESRPFLVLEYIEGRSVATIIRNREPAPVAVRLRWLEGLCDGLQFAHDRGIIHRDIKPANLMIDHLDRLRILDFGIARIAGAARTQYSGLMGTPAYMAPEYVRGEEADYRADIFAAGAVAYELLTFEPAFPGKTHATIIHRVMECAPPTFIEVGAVDVDPQLEQIILGALQKNPDERFQTAREFGEALRAVRLRIERTGEPVPAPHSATVVRVADSVASDATWHVPGRDLPPPSYTVPMGGTLGAGDVLEALDAGANRPVTAANTGDAVASDDAPSELVDHSSRRPYAVVAAVVALAAVAVFAVVTYLRVPEQSATLSPPPVTETPPPVSETTSTAGTGAAGASSGGGEIAGGSTAKPPALPPSLKPTDPGPAPGGGSPPLLTNTAAPVTAKSLFDGVGAVGGATNPGLLYRVFRLTDNDTPVSVDPETTTFRTGKDRVRFAFQPNVDGFLYVAQEATNGRWDVLFPDPDINGGRNDVESFKTYMIPSDSWFNLSPPSGTDKVFVFLSKTRVVELPGLNRPVTSHETLAQADVNRLSETISRRVLVLERTNLPQSSSSGGGDATYVVHRESLAGAVTVTFNVTHK